MRCPKDKILFLDLCNYVNIKLSGLSRDNTTEFEDCV